MFSGFVAQEVEQAAKSTGYDFSGVDKPKNENDMYGLRYAEFVVPLVKAVQELSKMNKDRDAKIDTLQKQINELKAILNSGNQTSSASTAGNMQKTIDISSASLEQNIPNPLNNTTSINYYIPAGTNKALLNIIDNSGNIIKQISLNSNGKGVVNIEASTLSAGTYSYSLIVNGKIIATKKMLIIR